MKRFNKQRNIITFMTIMVFSISCSNLLYFPDHVLYVNEELMEFKPEDVVVKIKSGQEVHGWYFSSKQKPKAVIVFFHGNGQNRSAHIIDVYWLIKEGYDLFAIEYPGYGETDGSPTPENTVEAGHAALRYVAQRQPKLPMVVYGQSLGGAVALRSVLDLKNEIPIQLVVVSSTFLSYENVGQAMLKRSWFTWLFQLLPKAIFDDKYAPGDRIKELAPIPLLVMHDKEDPVVPYSQGVDLFNKAAEPKEMWELEGRNHGQPFSGDRGPEMRKRFLERLVKVNDTKHPSRLTSSQPASRPNGL